MASTDDVSLSIHALYDRQREAVGLDLRPSEAFESGADTRAIIEILAAVTAQANFLAGEAIRAWDADEDRKKELFDHYAAIKEHMLDRMIHDADAAP